MAIDYFPLLWKKVRKERNRIIIPPAVDQLLALRVAL
jgi:hypothetical protein